jgi:hypothetical protein
MTRVIARQGYTSRPDWVPVSRVCRVPRHLDRPRNARRSGRRGRPIWGASSRIVVQGYALVMARTSHSAVVTRLFTRAPVLLTLPPATSSVTSSATSSLDPMGAIVEAIPARGDDGTATTATWPAIRPAASPTRPGPAGGSSAADRGPHSLGGRDGAAVRRDRRTRGCCAPRDTLGARRRVTGSTANPRLDLPDNPNQH